MIEFEDPRAEPGMSIEPYELTAEVSAPLTIGLLANGFPDSEAFLDHVQKALADAVPHASFHRYNKRNASAVVTDAMLDTIVAECQAVVGAYGH